MTMSFEQIAGYVAVLTAVATFCLSAIAIWNAIRRRRIEHLNLEHALGNRSDFIYRARLISEYFRGENSWIWRQYVILIAVCLTFSVIESLDFELNYLDRTIGLLLIVLIIVGLGVRVPNLIFRVLKTTQASTTEELARVTHNVENLKRELERTLEVISHNGIEESDDAALWQTAPGSVMTLFNPNFSRDVSMENTPSGARFVLNPRTIAWMLPKITVGSALRDWRIIFLVPNVDRQFLTQALVPARRFLFAIDQLGEIAQRRGDKITLEHVRISMIRSVASGLELSTICLLTRGTGNEVESISMIDQRLPSGKILVYRNVADIQYYQRIASDYFFQGLHLTLNDLRKIALTGEFPGISDVQVMGDSLRIERR